MRSDLFTVALLLFTSTPSFAVPQPLTDVQLIERDDATVLEKRDISPFSDASDLWKRKGGGGGGGKGGGGSSSSGSSSGGTSSGGKTGGTSGLVFSTLGLKPVDEESWRKFDRETTVGSSTPLDGGCSGGLEVSGPGDDGLSRSSSSLELRAPAAASPAALDEIKTRSWFSFIRSRYTPMIIALPYGFDDDPLDQERSNNKSSSTSGGRGSSGSNSGGATKQGSGSQPSYGGGKYYGGGSARPYSSGGVSPRGITPLYFGAGALILFPGIWLYGAYAYPYHSPYGFYNRTGRRNTTTTRRGVEIRQDDTGANETKEVQCLCAAYVECGCDDPEDNSFLDSLIGDGDYSKLNKSLINVYDYANGTSIIVLNGTLDNGTTIPGGDEDANGTSGAARMMVESCGYWVMIALVGFTVFLV